MQEIQLGADLVGDLKGHLWWDEVPPNWVNAREWGQAGLNMAAIFLSMCVVWVWNVLSCSNYLYF